MACAAAPVATAVLRQAIAALYGEFQSLPSNGSSLADDDYADLLCYCTSQTKYGKCN